MKFKFAKLFFAVSVLGFTTVSFAQPPESTVGPEPVYNYGNNFLNSIHGWHVTGGTFINRFSNNGTTYAVSFIDNPNNNAEIEAFSNVSTSNHWGWYAGIGYYLDCADMDFNFDWYSFSGADSSNVSGFDLNPVFDRAGTVGFSTAATGQVDNSYDTGALTVGHQMRPSPFFTVFYFGGLRYAHFSKNMTISANGGPEDYFANMGASFNGWGPTFGINADTYPFYYLLPYLSFSGGLQGSFLYGNYKTYSREVENFEGELFFSFNELPTSKIVAPVFSGSLAINYLWLFNGWGLKTTFGYQDTVLFGVNRPNGSFSPETNASFQGFYLYFTLRF